MSIGEIILSENKEEMTTESLYIEKNSDIEEIIIQINMLHVNMTKQLSLIIQITSIG